MEIDILDNHQLLQSNQSNSEITLFEFPCRFPIKIMALKQEKFSCQLLEIIRVHDPKLVIEDISIRESSKGNYLGATVIVNAVSKAQLDAIYLALTSHPMVKVVL